MSPSVVDTIKMEVSPGNSHHLHHRLAGIYEFRLQSSRENSEAMTSTPFLGATTTTSSVGSDRLSIHKQKIDSMFDETRSSVSGVGTPTFSRRGRMVLDDLEEEDEEEYDEVDDGRQNTVQERIQKMFAEVTKDERLNETRSGNLKTKEGEQSEKNDEQNHFTQKEIKSSSQHPSYKGFPAVSIRPQVFSVHYLGSAPLPNRDATLQALQYPLKTLYFRYRALEICGRAPPLNGTLEISSEGLRVKMAKTIEERKPGIVIRTEQLDKLNKFPSIAVWAAVKFVKRDSEESTENGADSTRYAFLPLIADPDGRDKSSLFRPFPQEESELAKGAHSPMFAVVMRRSSRANGPNAVAKRTLHCHAFICACSEDAIVMAANLYQALVAGMSSGRKAKAKIPSEGVDARDSREQEVDKHIRDPPARKDLRGMSSVAKRPSSVSGGEVVSRSSPPRQSDMMSSVSAPVRPPRKKKGSSRYGDDGRSSNSEDVLSLDDEEEPRRREGQMMRRTTSVPTNNLKVSSTTSLNAPKHSITPKDSSGDIFTKVVIPRSGSFLEHGANLRRTSSMGLGDLFLEVRAQEGLTSLDAILEKIVDADGMSYARLKPLYKEFLLKLAATLSRDELYQRSKRIMKRQLSSRRRRGKTRSGLPSGLSERKSPREEEDLSSASGDNLEGKKGGFSWSLCTSSSKIRAKSSGGAGRGDKSRTGGKRSESTKGGEGGEGTSCNFEFTSVIFPSETRRPRVRAGSSSISSSVSSSSRTSKSRRQRRKQFHAHRPSFNAGRSIRGSHVQQSRPALPAADAQHKPRVSTSEDSSDFFSFKRRTSVRNISTADTNTKSSSRMGSTQNGLGGGRSSSGYVSCSDCSFDSESCNSDKCYCPQEPLRRHQNSRISKSNRRDSVRNGMYAEVQHHGGNRVCQRVDGSGCGGGGTGNPQGVMRGHSQCRVRQSCIHQCGGYEDCHGSCASPCGCHVQACGVGRCPSAPPVKSCSVHGQAIGTGCSLREMCCQHVAGRCCGCCCLARADSPSTAWRKNERRMTGKTPGGGAEEVEDEDEEDWEDEDEDEGAAVVLEDGASAVSSSSWRPGASVPRSRMEVYATLPPPRPLPETPGKGQRDATKVVYEKCGNANRGAENRQRTSSQVRDCVASLEAKQQKVLVVSARDPKGRMICMGRGDQSNVVTTTALGSQHMLPGRCCSKSTATEALSVKKSAEIAAIFSDSTSHNQVGSMVSGGDEVVYTTLEPPGQGMVRSKGKMTELFVGRNYCNGNSLENTLGYLP